MQLRKVANPPLLVRTFYSDEKATKMAQLLHSNDEEFAKKQLNHLIEDFLSYSDFELHKLAVAHKYLAKFRLTDGMLKSPAIVSEFAVVKYYNACLE